MTRHSLPGASGAMDREHMARIGRIIAASRSKRARTIVQSISRLPGNRKPAGAEAAAGAIPSIIYVTCLPYVLLKVNAAAVLLIECD